MKLLIFETMKVTPHTHTHTHTRGIVKFGLRLLTLFLCLFLLSCEKPEDDFDEMANNSGNEDFLNQKNAEPNGFNVLGAKLNVPYKKSVMTQAKQNLVAKGGTGATSINVRTMHIYIRFLPQDKEQLDNLMGLGLTLFDIPLDYKIVRHGASYHDPMISDSIPTPQYTVVDPSFSYSGVA